MAISINTAGSWAYAAAGSVSVTLPTHATGNMLLVRVAAKSSAIATLTTTTATSGWAKVGEFYDGAGNNSGNGTGSVNVAVFWKIAASAAEPNPTIDFDEVVTQVGHVAISYQKGATENWLTPVGDGGYDATADTSKSMTIASHVSVAAGDMIDFFMGIRDNCTMTVPTFTQTGVTYGTVSEQPATAGTDTSGADGAYDGGYRLASSGTSSAAAVVTGTLDTSETGSAWTTRLRVTADATFNAEVATATGATLAPSVTVEPNAGVATATGSALDATVLTGIIVNAGVATATGAALDPKAEVVANAGLATATGAALAPALIVSPSAGLATGTGAALNATVQVSGGAVQWGAWSSVWVNDVALIQVDTGLATATGAALNPALDVSPNAGLATAIAAAYNPSISIVIGAGVATASGQAYDAEADVANIVNAGVATGSGIAYDPSLIVAVWAGLATGTATAYDGTVSTEVAVTTSGSAIMRLPSGQDGELLESVQDATIRTTGAHGAAMD